LSTYRAPSPVRSKLTLELRVVGCPPVPRIPAAPDPNPPPPRRSRSGGDGRARFPRLTSYGVAEHDQFRSATAAASVAAAVTAPAIVFTGAPGELLVGTGPGAVTDLLIGDAGQWERLFLVVIEAVSPPGAGPTDPTVLRVEHYLSFLTGHTLNPKSDIVREGVCGRDGNGK
jgi:hypothetical protein